MVGVQFSVNTIMKDKHGGEVNLGFQSGDFPTNTYTEPERGLTGSNDFVLVTETSNREKISTWVRNKTQRVFSKKTLLKRVPILNWLPQYNCKSAVGDLIAGLTVALTLIPQVLAYSNIAQLPPQYGLYSSFMGCFVYIIFGSCKDVAVGPSAISALLTAQTVRNKGPQHAILLCFLTGVVQIVMSLFGLGFLINFISGPVSSGFTSAVALIIVASQVKDILGIKATGITFFDIIESIIDNIHDTSIWDFVFGLSCIVFLLLMRILVVINVQNIRVPHNKCHYLNSVFWLIGVSRNAILVIVSCSIGYYLSQDNEKLPFKIVGPVPEGLPSVQPPSFSYTYVEINNTITETFFDMLSDLDSGIIVVPLLGLLEDIAVCKAFANGKTVDATQELLALGISNTASSFFQAFPSSGALARSAVNNASGVKTPLGGLYTGTLVILSLLYLTPYFYYIPKPALAAIIIVAAIFMVEIKVLRPMWRAKKSDLVTGVLTFVACLALHLQYGILIGIAINIIYILYHAARPKITIERLTSNKGVDYLLLTPDRCLIFPSAEYVRNLVNKQSTKERSPVVIDCSHIYGADYTTAIVMDILVKEFSAREQPLLFYNLKPSVSAVFDGLSSNDFMIYYNEDDIDDILKRWNMKRQGISQV